MRIGFLGFGEAGYVLSKALLANGLPSGVAFDIASNEKIRQRAADAGVTLLDSNRGLAAHADCILSVVTADSAREAASQTAPFLTKDHIFCDCNSVSPATKIQIAEICKAAQFVEAAIMAPVHPSLDRVPLLLTGASASRLAQHMAQFGMKMDLLDGPTGTAAAVKMCRSIIVKGLEALTLECTVAATQFNCVETVFASLDRSHPGFHWNNAASYMIERVLQHGTRRAAEMREVAAMQTEAGLTPVMSLAAAEVQAWRSKLPDARIENNEDLISALGVP